MNSRNRHVVRLCCLDGFIHRPVGMLLLLLQAALCFGQPASEKRPNIVLIIADDLGYSDLSSYGNAYVSTPNIDRLGEEGVKFLEAYATSPICSPSRVAILTGRYQQRFGNEFMPYDRLDPGLIHNLRHHFHSLKKQDPGLSQLKPHIFVNRRRFNNGLPATETTLAQLLKQEGYATGLVGKWNIGNGDGFYPDQKGFDYSYYFEGALTRYVDDPVDTSRYINQHLPWAFSELPAWAPRYGSTAIKEGRQEVKDTGYLTFSFAQKAIDFISKNYQHPFFLVLSFNAPHDPFQVPKEYFDRITGVQDSVKRVYYGMIEALDDAIGNVMQKLTETGVDSNTLVIFVSDNGGATYTRATDNKPLRGGKCTHFDGGLKVPLLMRYPAALNGGKSFEKPVSTLDIFSTIAAVAHAPLPNGRTYDGVNLAPLLQHKTDSIPHQIFYWRNGYSKAIRKDNWKLYVNTKSKKTFLFDLRSDNQELHDVKDLQPAKVLELQQDLQQWEKTHTIKPAWRSAANVLIDVHGEWFWFPT